MRGAALVAIALVLGGCDTKAQLCEPGATVPCACPRTTGRGVQSCRDDGAGLLACTGCPPGAGFTEVAIAAGLSFVQSEVVVSLEDCTLQGYCEPDMQSGGAAVGDYDGDGDMDLFVTRLGAPPILYQNQGDGTFADVSDAAGVEVTQRANGAAFGDVENDGDEDLYVTALGDHRYYLLINDGAGHFTEQGGPRGVAIETVNRHVGYTPTFGDYDRDGYLDLHTNEWDYKKLWTDPGLPGHTRLLRNFGLEAPGYFDDQTTEAGVTLDDINPDGNAWAFSSAFVDLDGDDWPDLPVVADYQHSRMFWSNRDGTFREGAKASGLARESNGMGLAFGDYDDDGKIDLFVTSTAPHPSCLEPFHCLTEDTGNHLYRNLGGGLFEDRALEAGVFDGGWGWGAAFADLDNDSRLDLVMTNGFPAYPVYEHDPMRLWFNRGTVWEERSHEMGLTETRQGRGLLVFDYDNDGDIDIFVQHQSDAPVLYRNENGGPYLRVDARTKDGRPAIGAKISVTTRQGGRVQTRHLGIQTAFLGQSEPIAHFGLEPGAVSAYEVRVRWPELGATETVLTDVPGNQVLRVTP